MRTFQQSTEVKELWSKQLGKKISEKRQEAQESSGEGFFGFLGTVAFEINQFSNQFKGSVGETVVSLLLKMLPDTWVMFNNALIPTNHANTLTEIDTLIIGTGGIFLVEIKTWKGSFSAYKDKWKRRDGNQWTAIDNSPSSQNAYHQKIFKQWIISKIPSFNTELITAPVVFTVATWLGINDCSVPVLHGVKPLINLLINSPNIMTPAQVDEIAELIKNYSLPQTFTPTPKPVPKPIPQTVTPLPKPVPKPIKKPKKLE